MLRDLLVDLPGVETWGCDEINYIWRHGNVRFPSDEFVPEMAAPGVRLYIQRQFDKLAAHRHADVVVEKTCANSLRVGFVDRIVTDAKYIFIVRNGLDASASALKRWHSGIELGYTLKKARYVPVADIAYYASRFLRNHLRRMLSQEKRLAFWGPALADMRQLLMQYSLEEVCALQWRRCVERAEHDFAFIAPDKLLRVRYEDFVAEPQREFKRIADFVGKELSDAVQRHLNGNVRSSSGGMNSAMNSLRKYGH